MNHGLQKYKDSFLRSYINVFIDINVKSEV